MCREGSFTIVSSGQPSDRCIRGVPGSGEDSFAPSRIVFGITVVGFCVTFCFVGLVVVVLCLLAVGHAVRGVAGRALISLCDTRLSVLGRICCLLDLTGWRCHFTGISEGIGILVVVRGVVHRAFKVSGYQG